MTQKTVARPGAPGQGPAVTVLGEVMIELSPQADGSFRPGVAGDTFNTAVALAQLGVPSEYVTALGTDGFSRRIRTAIEARGIGDSHIATSAGAVPGLYAIETDAAGERRFTYWRDQSAARQWFGDVDRFAETFECMCPAPFFYWSGITLALMAPAVRECLFRFLEAYRAGGGRVYFDSNYRAALWRSQDSVAAIYDSAIAHTDLYLPSLDDECAIRGLDSEVAITAALQRTGVAEAVMTLPGEALWITPQQVTRYALPQSAAVVDTTGAGDAFSGALMAGLIGGAAMPAAIRFAHRVAAAVVGVQGALLPEKAWREFTELCERELSCQP
ncbi:sugar kinase [Exilibacterium tricleocarpae]|uniref:Sugar kinase n=1 Tax=Exilibacterium tricleocarpae TaxID=2591008 RepID=A0A545U6K8_9GAMM|nr:sugar kinase [Exilibacterium tricleocarpae]TQV85109.1 sugar kinase [Exilibacterium tricleocarpae]